MTEDDTHSNDTLSDDHPDDFNSQDDQSAREEIGRTLRLVSQICEQDWGTAQSVALPMLRNAASLARKMEDRTPFVLCLNQIAWIHAMSNNESQAHKTIQRSLEVAENESVSESVRFRTTSQFIDLSLVTKQEPERAHTYSIGLLQQILDHSEQPSSECWQNLIDTILKLSAIASELKQLQKSSFAILSWLAELLSIHHHQSFNRVEELLRLQSLQFQQETREEIIIEIEKNRSEYLNEITKGILPDHQPSWLKIIPAQP